MTTMTFKPGQLYHLPPGDLLLERNIRDAVADADLVESIRDRGVMQPITAVLNPDGVPLVRHGHRRTLAAIEADQVTVPVYVVAVDDLSAAAEVARIIAQRDENTRRAGLTAANEVDVVDQLVAFGLTAEQLTAQARIGKDGVATAFKVSKSKLAKKAAEKYSDLTLDHVAAVAEFEDDTTTAQHLIATAIEKPDTFAHVLQRARDDREREQKRERSIAEIEASGAKYSTARPGYGSPVLRLDRLLDKRGGKEITFADHKSCAGHIGWIDNTGDADYGCADPKKYGHHDRYSNAKPAAAEMTPAERDKAAAERKLVVENNKAWTSAEKVRRNWLTEFAKCKNPPKGTAAFIAVAITLDSGQFGYDSTPGELTSAWLGTQRGQRGDLTKVVTGASEARALVIALVHILAVYEATLTKDSWRGDGTTNAAGRYLRFLESCGYGLSDVEKFAISGKTA